MYTSAPRILIRAPNNSDPMTGGHEGVGIAIKTLAGAEVRVGDGVEGIFYAVRALRLERRCFSFACVPLVCQRCRGLEIPDGGSTAEALEIVEAGRRDDES